MHYGGSTLDAMTPDVRQYARAINALDDLGKRRGGLTVYQQSVRFWCYTKVRLANHHTKGDTCQTTR